MRKIVIISIVFAAMLVVSVWEISYSTKLFNNLKDDLILLEQSIYQHDEDIDNPDTLAIMQDVTDRWNVGREVLFCFGNHNTFRNLDEKIVSLEAMVKTNYCDDAKVMVRVTISQIEGVCNETIPVPSNLF